MQCRHHWKVVGWCCITVLLQFPWNLGGGDTKKRSPWYLVPDTRCKASKANRTVLCNTTLLLKKNHHKRPEKILFSDLCCGVNLCWESSPVYLGFQINPRSLKGVPMSKSVPLMLPVLGESSSLWKSTKGSWVPRIDLGAVQLPPVQKVLHQWKRDCHRMCSHRPSLLVMGWSLIITSVEKKTQD